MCNVPYKIMSFYIYFWLRDSSLIICKGLHVLLPKIQFKYLKKGDREFFNFLTLQENQLQTEIVISLFQKAKHN